MAQFFTDPAGFIVTVLTLIVLVVIWAIRGEGKGNALSQVVKLNKEIQDHSYGEMNAKINELSSRVNNHEQKREAIEAKIFDALSSLQRDFSDKMSSIKEDIAEIKGNMKNQRKR